MAQRIDLVICFTDSAKNLTTWDRVNDVQYVPVVGSFVKKGQLSGVVNQVDTEFFPGKKHFLRKNMAVTLVTLHVPVL